MSQNTSAKSPTASSSLSINPALQAALGSLDVQLEAELARYRRQRRGRGFTSPQLPRNPKQKSGVNQLEPTTMPPISIAPAADSGSFPADIDQPSSQLESSPTPETRESPETESTPTLFPPPPHQEASLVTTPDQTATDSPNLEDSLEDGKITVPTPDQSQPEDYLESSEKLRQTLAEQETRKESQKPVSNRILTPLGVGSILLLLVSSATLTYIFRMSLGLDGFLETETPTTTENLTATTANEENEILGVNKPNLASNDEFPDVNISTLPNLKANPTSSPTASPIAPIPNPVPPAASPPAASVPLPQLPNPASNLPSALLAPPTPSGNVSPPATPSATPNSSPAQPESAANKSSESDNNSTSEPKTPNNVISNLNDEFYYVLINSSESSVLETAQTIVPDAYIVNIPAGTRIAMGAFKLESEAKTLVEQLQQQGLSASIYKPE